MKKLLFCLCALLFLHCTEVPEYGVLKVSVSPAGSGSVQMSPAGTEYEDGTTVTLVAEAEYGYEFVGWSGNVSEMNSSITTIVVQGDEVVIANFVQRPDKPRNVYAVSSNNGISIDWSPVSNATGYYIYRSEGSSGSYKKIGISATASYIDNNIQLGTTYYYEVSAYNGSVESQRSDYKVVSTQLSAPIGVMAIINSAGEVTISWSSVAGATGYRIYRSTSSSGNYTSIGSSATTLYTDETVVAGATYYYKVVAYNSSSESLQSSTAFAATQLGTPDDVTATSNSTTSVTISWRSVSNATGYYIYRSTSSAGAYSKYDNTTNTSYTDNVSSGTTYYYKVSAYNSNGESQQSNAASATTQLSTPYSVSATANSSGITVSWSSVSGATGYHIYRSTSSYGTYTQVVGTVTSMTSFTDNTCPSGTTCYYKVAAYNNNGESLQSSYDYATMPLSAPTGLTATASSSSITISWSSVSGATGYYIYRSTSSSGTYSKYDNTSYASYTDTWPSSGTTYYYKVSAYNSNSGESQQSAYISARTTSP